MSAEDKNEEVLGPDVKTPEPKDIGVEEAGGNIADNESVMSNADGGVQTSIAPQVEGVSNTEGIGIIEKKIVKGDENEEDVKVLFPKLFVDKAELLDVEIEVVFDPKNGDVYSISQPGLINSTMLEVLMSVRYTFRFRPVSYDDMQKYRRQASFYDANAGDLVINRLSLRNFLLINHLRETDMVDDDGQPIQIKLDPETDNLSLESLSLIYQTTPALLDVVLTLFERKLLILFQASQTNM